VISHVSTVRKWIQSFSMNCTEVVTLPLGSSRRRKDPAECKLSVRGCSALSSPGELNLCYLSSNPGRVMRYQGRLVHVVHTRCAPSLYAWKTPAKRSRWLYSKVHSFPYLSQTHLFPYQMFSSHLRVELCTYLRRKKRKGKGKGLRKRKCDKRLENPQPKLRKQST
jgi:hypothetical protein